MIVLGADTHKRSHTVAAVAAATGELLGEQTVAVGGRGFAARSVGARPGRGAGLGAGGLPARVGVLRAVLDRSRRAGGAGPDAADGRPSAAVALAAASPTRSTRSPSPAPRCAEGVERLPVAELAGVELDIRLLVDHRERLVRMRTALNNDAALASARPVARADVARLRAALKEVATARRPAPRARRADRAGSDRPRRAAPHARADADHQRARDRDR